MAVSPQSDLLARIDARINLIRLQPLPLDVQGRAIATAYQGQMIAAMTEIRDMLMTAPPTIYDNLPLGTKGSG